MRRLRAGGGRRQAADTPQLPVWGLLKAGAKQPGSAQHCLPGSALPVLPSLSAPSLDPSSSRRRTGPHLRPAGPPVCVPGPAPRSAPSPRAAPSGASLRKRPPRASLLLLLLSGNTRSSLGRRGSSRSATAAAATLLQPVGGAVPRPWCQGGPLGSRRRAWRAAGLYAARRGGRRGERIG